MSAKQLTALMLVIVSVLYTIAAVGYWYAGRPGMTFAFAGYVTANIGFIWDAL